MALLPLTASTGLSPLARGNPDGLDFGIMAGGSIPACAGEPALATTNTRRRRVYPRLRGGTCWKQSAPWVWRGLSPLARGNLVLLAELLRSKGSIPACAGEPTTWANASPARWVYPRLRGGTTVPGGGAPATKGLSPLARGNRLLARVWCLAAGSIPACAGEPGWRCGALDFAGVYPRLRGGTGLRRPLHARQQGLSPLARGNQIRGESYRVREGSIPACAGEP